MLDNAHHQKRGYVTLISVLIIGAVGIAVASSLLMLGLLSSRTSFVYGQSGQARVLASACAEEGLQQIVNDTSFSGAGMISFENGNCTYEVTARGKQRRDMEAVGEVGAVIRKIEVAIDRVDPQLEIGSWQEVADF